MFKKYKIIFWDFDGVIKDSVFVKTKAYLNLFPSLSTDLREKIEKHHLRFGGISRMTKIPLYLEWVGLPTDEFTVKSYCEKFSELVLDAVINSTWIDGVQEVLDSKAMDQIYVLVTGTPQDEIEVILKELKLIEKFDYIFGSPAEKSKAIESVLLERSFPRYECLMIGDSQTDYEAAKIVGIDFLLRTDNDDSFGKSFNGRKIKDFKEFI
ncbi:HAD hydrolase-like protein [Leptospira sp. 96542]|nr:HAD hydrolase-like protein [Leptospira sp. 96542]